MSSAGHAMLPVIRAYRAQIDAAMRKYAVQPGGCWNWTGAVGSTGYGSISLSCRIKVRAHRVAYALHHGEPGRLLVRHKCDNPLCINPNHLALGTHKDNMQDVIDRARHGDTSGSRNPNAKLTENDVIEIARLLPRLNNCQIASRLNGKITHSMVSRIRRGHSWSHVSGIAPS